MCVSVVSRHMSRSSTCSSFLPPHTCDGIRPNSRSHSECFALSMFPSIGPPLATPFAHGPFGPGGGASRSVGLGPSAFASQTLHLASPDSFRNSSTGPSGPRHSVVAFHYELDRISRWLNGLRPTTSLSIKLSIPQASRYARWGSSSFMSGS